MLWCDEKAAGVSHPQFMPVFALTALFRCGAGVINVLHFNNFAPFSPPFTIFFLYCYILGYYFWFMMLGYMLKVHHSIA